MFDSLVKGAVYKKILVYFLLIIISIIAIFPVYWIVSSSFKSRVDWTGFPPSFIPSSFTLSNYKYIIKFALFPFLPNSIIIAVFSTILAIFLGLISGYSLSRFNFRGKNQVANYIISSRFMPPIVLLLPLLVFLLFLNLIDKIILMIVLYTIMNSSFSIWMLKNFIDDIPKELDEAALVDGCSRIGILIKIIIPNLISGIVVVAVFCLTFTWNEFILAFAFTKINAATLPISIMKVARSERGLELGPISAITTIGIIPIMIFVFFLQRYIVRGLTLGALKE